MCLLFWNIPFYYKFVMQSVVLNNDSVFSLHLTAYTYIAAGRRIEYLTSFIKRHQNQRFYAS